MAVRFQRRLVTWVLGGALLSSMGCASMSSLLGQKTTESTRPMPANENSAPSSAKSGVVPASYNVPASPSRSGIVPASFLSSCNH